VSCCIFLDERERLIVHGHGCEILPVGIIMGGDELRPQILSQAGICFTHPVSDLLSSLVVHHTAPPPLRLGTPPTYVEEVSSDDSLLSDSSGYNDECPHVKELSLSI
jgi:hypothetical protein